MTGPERPPLRVVKDGDPAHPPGHAPVPYDPGPRERAGLIVISLIAAAALLAIAVLITGVIVLGWLALKALSAVTS